MPKRHSNAYSSAPLSTHEALKESKEKTETMAAPSGATVPPTETSELDFRNITELQRIEQAELLMEAREERERIVKEYCEMQRQGDTRDLEQGWARSCTSSRVGRVILESLFE